MPNGRRADLNEMELVLVPAVTVFRNASMASDADDNGERANEPSKTREPRDRHDVGAALRVAYREAIEEPVPDDLLDLLGKLD